MTDDADRTRPAHWIAVVWVGAVVALLDGLVDVLVYSAVMRVVGPARLFQGIAVAILGRPAFDGGVRTVALGIGMHAAVAYAWTIAYWVADARVPALRWATRTHAGALGVGAVYGVLVCTVMNASILPLTHAHALPLASGRFALQAAIHVLAVGFPIVLLARRRG